MYFCLIHAHGDQTGRISAPPPMCPEVPPASDVSTLEESLYFSARGVVDTGGGGDGGADGGGGNQSDEGAVEMTDDNQLFRFWDGEANGKLVQAPLNLDRRGRGWCKVCYMLVFTFRRRILVDAFSMYGQVNDVRAYVVSFHPLSRFPRFRV